MDRQQYLSLLLQKYSSSELITKLEPYLTDERHQRINDLLDAKLADIDIAIEAPSDPHNAAAVVRSAEVFGLSHVHVINVEGKALEAKRTTKGAFHWIECHYHDDIEQFIQQRQQQGVKVYGAALNQQTTLEQLDITKPCCVLFGNEQRGLTAHAQQACDQLFSIPMFGMSESLNLSVAAAISIYNLTQRKRNGLTTNGNLSDEEKNQSRLEYYAHTVNYRLLDALLNT